MSTPPAPTVKTEPVWWEKTVEYKFVLDCLSRRAEAFPLAGNVETNWGDLLFGEMTRKGYRFRLIEFKRSATEIRAEKEKFPSMHSRVDGKILVVRGHFHSLLKTKHPGLSDLAGYQAHWFIYGDVVDVPQADGEMGVSLRLRFRQYGAEVDDGRMVSLAALASVDYLTMVEYLEALALLRSSGDMGGSGGGGGTILGVSSTRAVLLSIADFLNPRSGFSPRQLLRKGQVPAKPFKP